jgi:hypothetical protein
MTEKNCVSIIVFEVVFNSSDIFKIGQSGLGHEHTKQPKMANDVGSLTCKWSPVPGEAGRAEECAIVLKFNFSAYGSVVAAAKRERCSIAPSFPSRLLDLHTRLEQDSPFPLERSARSYSPTAPSTSPTSRVEYMLPRSCSC